MVKKVTKNYHVIPKHNLTQEELLLEKFTSFLITLSLLFLSSFIHSATLADVYELALTSDPQLKIDEATFKANKEIKNKAMAGLLPKLSLRAGTTWNENKNTESNASLFTDTQGSNSNYYSANLIQPIFRVDSWFQFSQGKALGEAAEAKFALSQQETIIRISNVYFNLLKAKKNLEVARLEEQSIKKQRDRTKRLYEEGVSSKSEYQEAQAFYDLAKVSKIATEGQLEFAREAMIAIIGDAPDIKDLNDDFPISKPDPIEQDQWAGLALANSFTLKASKLNATAAKKNSQAKLASHFPDIDLVASITQNNSRGIVDLRYHWGVHPSAPDRAPKRGIQRDAERHLRIELQWDKPLSCKLRRGHPPERDDVRQRDACRRSERAGGLRHQPGGWVYPRGVERLPDRHHEPDGGDGADHAHDTHGRQWSPIVLLQH